MQHPLFYRKTEAGLQPLDFFLSLLTFKQSTVEGQSL